jgi:glycosyltransferase involved in cell wall biosynthesis
MKVKYCGPARDYSGYGEANRHDIGALNAAGIEVTTQIPQYCLEISDTGRLGELATKLEGRELGYKVKILHVTPNVYKQYMEEGVYHVGRVFWETDKLPLDFAINVQLLDEIWTGSEFNAQAIRNSGVTKPIYIIPEAIDTETGEVEPYVVPNDIDYKFYSMFEWTERKNPSALLEAYWREFNDVSNVSLTIKTYVDNFTPDKRQEIKDNIRRIKKQLQFKTYAPVYLYTQLMDRHQVYRFHKTFDCFVSAHRGEGWGIPQMEAMLMGKPVISTNCGGIHEYLRRDFAFPIPCTMVNLSENTRNKQWYTMDQKWGQVDIDELRKAMRYAFENREKVETMGQAAKQFVIDNFSLAAVGKKMRDRLTELNRTFEPNPNVA